MSIDKNINEPIITEKFEKKVNKALDENSNNQEKNTIEPYKENDQETKAPQNTRKDDLSYVEEKKKRHLNEGLETPAFIVPTRVQKYYIEVDGKYYFTRRPDSLAFIDKGTRLQTRLSNNKVTSSMMDVAEAKGWGSIQVKGSYEFRRAAWMEAAARGITVRGYNPKKTDLSWLKNTTTNRQTNEIISGAEINRSEANRLAGKLVEYGKAPYKHSKDNNSSYYVTLENSDGERNTVWGVGLEKARDESGAKKGEVIKLENTGREPVTVKHQVRDEQGNVTRVEDIEVTRNTWKIETDSAKNKEEDSKNNIKEHPDLLRKAAAIKVAEKFSKQRFSSETNREEFMGKVQSRLSKSLSKGEKIPEIKLREKSKNNREKESEYEEYKEYQASIER